MPPREKRDEEVSQKQDETADERPSLIPALLPKEKGGSSLLSPSGREVGSKGRTPMTSTKEIRWKTFSSALIEVP